jgi:hypothetical protein
MESQITSDERAAFTSRLCDALTRAGYSHSPTELALQFNLRSDGPAITSHAARKWLHAESFPTQSKLLVLAHWLLLSPQWLRYGEGPAISIDSPKKNSTPLPMGDRILLQDINCLDERAQQVVRDLVATLLRNTVHGAQAFRTAQDEGTYKRIKK